VKHLSEAGPRTVVELCRAAGITIDLDRASDMVEYLDLLIDKNKVLNLTRITGDDAALRLHIVDSLLALPEMEAAPQGTVLDLGSGGGFPGVPLCVATGRRGVLLDSVAKKATAVAELLSECGLDSQIVSAASRAETWSNAHRGEYGVVLARAVAPLPSLVELASPLLRRGGWLVALKGSPSAEELERGAAVARIAGMREANRRTCEVPSGGELRTIVSYERVGQSDVKLPRRVGMAQNRPLA
jgi:16S rRNA (guanine527-N7)-methyltransferase